ncbi:MAG: VWA domain-containing protein [Pyrinomonadaceae bacterium]
MRFKFLVLTLLVTWFNADFALGQDKKPADDDVVRVETQLVDVPVAVTSTGGVPIAGLKASNFVLYEDGKRQAITGFAATAEPFEVALLLDTSGSARSDLPLIQRAAQNFIASLRSGDRVSVMSYKTERKDNQAYAVTEVLSQLTDDRKALRTAVENVRTSNGTPLYDSLIQVAEKIFGQRPSGQFRGRRALVALTDGVDSTSGADFALAKELLAETGVVIFFIKVDTQAYFEENLMGDCQSATRFSAAQIRRYYRGIAATGKMEKAASFCELGEFERLAVSKRLYEIADTEMADLARISGGKVYPVGDLNEARSAFKSVAGEIGTKYTLGYYPTNDKRDGAYRRIRVELTGLPKGAQVRAREGYTAPTN